MEKSTGELLSILKSKKDYSQFLKDEINELYFKSIGEYFQLLIAEKGLKKSEIIKKSNLDKNYAYQIFNGTKTNPSRDKIIMLAFGMNLTVDETRKLIKICELPDLYVRNPRDGAIIFCLEKGYSLLQTNEMLNDLKLDILE